MSLKAVARLQNLLENSVAKRPTPKRKKQVGHTLHINLWIFPTAARKILLAVLGFGHGTNGAPLLVAYTLRD